jgi:hypothetical protein
VEAALGWLGDICRALLQIFPHLILINFTHAGVKFKYGCELVSIECNNGIRLPAFTRKFPFVRLINTGVHIYWPICSSVMTMPIKRQTAKLSPQYLQTKDGKTVTIAGVVVFDVFDAVKLLTENFDPDQTVKDYCMSEIRAIVECVTLDDLSSQGYNIDHDITKTLRRHLRKFGLRVIRYRMTDLAACRMYGLMTRDTEIPKSFAIN